MNNIEESEIFKTLEGFSKYEIGNKGTVRRRAYIDDKQRFHEAKILKTVLDEDGYVCISICDNTRRSKNFRIHRLVAQAFIPVDGKSTETVNHKDGNKQNNCVENLEWMSRKENTEHFWKADCFEELRNNSFYHKEFNAEYRRKLSEANLRRDPEIYKRATETQKGRIVVNNGVENRHIDPEKLDEFLANGYVMGCKPRPRRAK